MILIDSDKRAFDMHCHFFNKEILSLRLLVELGMILRRKKQENAVDSGTISTITRFLHFLKVGLLPVEKIYTSLEKNERGFAFCPLMFDLEGCMLSGGNDNAIDERQMIRQVVRELDGEISSLNSREWNELREFVEQLENSDQLTSNSFELQEKQLVDLVKKYPDRVHPFFAVDPRRRELFDDPGKQAGIKKIVSRLRVNGGSFSGIKRIGYVSDLMDTYQVYSDMEFLNEALEAAYRLLSPDGRDEMVLPGKTVNVCRLLCNCYYFTG